MHVAGSPADVRAFDRHGVVCTQPAGDKERESFGRQWDQRVEVMRDVIIAFRNHPSILFWEAGNNSISKEHMREMRQLKEALDPNGGRFMGCRTLNTPEVVEESEYVGTMLNRHAARFIAEHGPVTETEYSREESPRRIWDDFTPPDFDYRNRWIGKGGKKAAGFDFYDLTSEDLARENARGYAEFFNDRIGGASGKNFYSACAALCWTDSAQHGRQAYSENGRMSGRVDPVRVKKQSFDVFRVMQSPAPAVKVIGHWNYPPADGTNYRYEEKRFNGQFWEGTGVWLTRDPRHKTVFVAASYAVKYVELFINGEPSGRCDTPENTFIFPFPDVDVTRAGFIEAVGYGYDGEASCRDRIETAGSPASLRLTPRTSPAGLLADGADVAYVDIEVLDDKGRLCPLADGRIDFEVSGPARFLGGYNSGRFLGHGRDDSVIHQSHVFAECGTNRVFLRAMETAGSIRITARMGDIASAAALESRPADCSALTEDRLVCRYAGCAPEPPEIADDFPAIADADRAKYVPDDRCYTKILINGQEPDTRGVRSVNESGSVWGAVLCILERLKTVVPDAFDYDWDAPSGTLTVRSGGHVAIARVGHTHLLVDGREELMDGEPYITKEGQLVMEVNALIPHIKGTRTQYDELVQMLRIET